MTETEKKILNALYAKRDALQKQYDAAIAEPASVSISGSVSYTNRALDEIKNEIASLDKSISDMLTGNGGGVALQYPQWRRP